MRHRLCLFVVCLLAGSAAACASAADVAPERLLAKESVAYVRFDGLASHQKAYDATSFAKIIDEEYQPLIDAIAKMIYDAVGPQILGERLLKGVRPAGLIKLQKAARELPRFVTQLRDRGFVAGVEMISATKGKFQVTLVFPASPPAAPGASGTAASVLGMFRLMGHVTEVGVEEVKLGKRTILQIADGAPVILSCWKEGPHTVLTIGTEDLKRTIALADGKRDNLLASPLFQKVNGFKKYETMLRGYINVGETLALIKREIPPAGAVLSAFGVDGLKEVSFHGGFDGKLQRSTLFVSLPEKRQGLLKIFSPKGNFSADKLPPLPPDVSTVAAGGLDLLSLYDEGLRSFRLLVLAVNPGEADEINKVLRQFEQSLGSKIRSDLVASLGSNYVIYSSPSEGPLMLGTTLAIEVKDAKKLKRTLDELVRNAATTFGVDVETRQRTYRGVTLNMLKFGGAEMPIVPTYVIHNGWFVLSMYPQPVTGYVYRSQKGRGVWEPPALLKRALADSLQPRGTTSPRLAGINVNDPRPTIKQLVSIAPLFWSFIAASGGDVPQFDLSLIPNAQAATGEISNNVTVIVDDGNGLRVEGYATFPLPFQMTGIDFYAYLGVLPYLFQVF